MSAAQTKAEGIINENPVAVFSKTWCPYCKATKTMLKEAGANFKVVELDEEKDGDAIQMALYEMTDQKSVPNIFIGQKHIGGNSELKSKEKELPELLKNAGAL